MGSAITSEINSDNTFSVDFPISSLAKIKELQGIVDQMAAFSMKHYPKTVFKDGKKRNYKQVFRRPVTVLH